MRVRLLRIINLSIAVLLVVFLIALYWFVYRPLPQTSGAIPAAISGPATVIRDERGVPHITASSIEDAIFLQGYVTAQDRLFQMDATRRFAAGELAEVVGPAALQLDRESRSLRVRRVAEDHWQQLPAADRALLTAYARGVNAFLETHRGDWPLEFTLLHYDPRPWRPTDTILAGLQMYRNLANTWRDEIEKQNLIAGGNPEKVNALFPVRSGREVTPGSNSWAVSGRRTASGKPILANDPHLDYAVPSTWYMVHIKAPGLNAIGVSLPGVPGVIIGHNERIAWGVTNLGFDVEDLYQETMDAQTGRYLFAGHQEQARFERETIAVKGRAPVEVSQWVTRHGPVIVAEGPRLMALRWAAAEPGSYQFPFLDLNRAQNWAAFTAALARFPGPAQNFVYADADGNIGYHVAGRLPIRRNYDGDVPVDGSSGANEWDGFIPFEQLPTYFNPERGYIVTANQNPFPADYPYRVSGAFAPPYRSRQIKDLLTARDTGWKPADMLTVQKDVYSPFLKFLALRAVAAFDRLKPAKPELAACVELLRNWNGQVEKTAAAPLVATLLFDQVRVEAANVASPGHGSAYTFMMSSWVVQSILESGTWFKDQDKTLMDSLGRAYNEGRKLQGGDVKRWNYGSFNELEIRHPVGSQIPGLGRYFNIGPVPMSGSSTTVKQTTRRLGPSMRFVADLSNWDGSLNNITVGESGQILSSHYKDEWDAYYNATSFPMEYSAPHASSTLQFRPR